VLPKTIHYRTFDGRSIPALLFVPPAASSKRRAPVIVSVHGGPEGQEQPYLTNYYQFLVARGYAVLAPNVRGSTGYGKTYVALDDGPRRWDALKDVEYGVRWIRQQPNLDADKAACFGASYGGFVTLAMLAHYPQLFCAGVDFYGPADLKTFLARTAPHRRPARIAEYGDPDLPDEAAFLASISPYHNLKPGMAYPEPFLVTSTKDDRVHPGHARKMAARMQAMGLPVLYDEKVDGGHSAAANLEERARRTARECTYLTRKLMD